MAWPEAGELFHSDPRWLGADAAFSIDLGQGRVLWMFNDTFVARKPANGPDEKIAKDTSLYFPRFVKVELHGWEPAQCFPKLLDRLSANRKQS
jgi:hypothetical protein